MGSSEVLRALLAGLIAGSLVAFGSTAIGIVALWRNPSWFARAPSLRVPLPLVGVALVNGFLLGWTVLGMVLGAVLPAVEATRPADGLGSPNAAFTAAIVAASLAGLAAAVVVRGRLGWPLNSMVILATLSFGWLLPWLGL
ncbi:MAG: hypothetical protein EXR66_05475 [Dehalococcoidia bacterium]|nr:hypothetical protein [Dehalococcoidia bacterium]